MKKNLTALPFRIAVLFALGMSSLAYAQQTYPTAQDAATALVDALGTTSADKGKLASVLGKNWQDLVPQGGVDRADVDAFLQQYRLTHRIDTPVAGKASFVVVGKDEWAFPIPLVQRPGGWSFDLKAGAEEIRIRRIGRNELAAVLSAMAYNDAQMDYAEIDHDGDGVLEYARKIISTNGAHDGLFWADDDSGDISPLGPLFGDAAPGGDWHGYQFRILDSQGASAPGGAYSYRLGENMSRGFALVAWPSKYADTGVMSFMISHDGQVFEKDLGPQSAAVAKAMKSFDPDSSWTETSPVEGVAGRK